MARQQASDQTAKAPPKGRRKATAKAASGADPVGRYKVEAVARAVTLLEEFRRGPGSKTTAQLARATGLAPRAVDAILSTLEYRGLMRRTAGEPDQFQPGLAWLRLADVKRRQLDIRSVALPVMRRVRDAVNETVSLTIRIGANRVNLEYAESQHEVRRITQPGFHVALHVGAGGRSLMSGLDDAQIEAYFAPIASSQMHKSKLIAAIKATRRDGYAIVEGEIASDTSAISAPIRNHVGEVVAAISISMPKERLGAPMRARAIKEATKGARDISMALGFEP